MARLRGSLRNSSAQDKNILGAVYVVASVANWTDEWSLTLQDNGKMALEHWSLRVVPMPGYVRAKTTVRVALISREVLQDVQGLQEQP